MISLLFLILFVFTISYMLVFLLNYLFFYNYLSLGECITICGYSCFIFFANGFALLVEFATDTAGANVFDFYGIV
jgi:hypothetical protein